MRRDWGHCWQTASNASRRERGSIGARTVYLPAPATPMRIGCRATRPSTTCTPTQILTLLKRMYFANRGVWEANVWAGPAVSVAATHEDVEHYLSVLEEVVGELAA